MTLLDTNALIWLHLGHARARPLTRRATPLYISPASVLELKFLAEVGRLKLRAHVADIANETGCLLDDPPSIDWFDRAVDVDWTRDPFDRLLVAHAQLRGWRLATGDSALVERLGSRDCVPL